MQESPKPHIDKSKVENNLTLILVCKNEIDNVVALFDSLKTSSVLPKEIIIIDGFSLDGTYELLQKQKIHGVKIHIEQVFSNISKARNIALKLACTPKVLITDFGVVLDKFWIENMSKTLDCADFVGGIYTFLTNNSWQKSYKKLFEPKWNKIDHSRFVPSSRSFGVRKIVIENNDLYREDLSIAEDTELVLRLRNLNYKGAINKKAKVYWEPRTDLKGIFIQHYKYCLWDGIARQNFKNLAFTIFFISSILMLFIPIIGMLNLVMLVIKFKKIAHPRPHDIIVLLAVWYASGIGFLIGLLTWRK